MSTRSQVAPEWCAALGLAQAEALNGLLDARGLPAWPGVWTMLSKPGLGRRERWRWVVPAVETPAAPVCGGSNSGFTLYVKRYGRPALREQFDRWWRQTRRHSRAWWEFQQSRALALAEIGAAPGVGYAEDMGIFLERRSAVCLAAAAGDAFDRAWPRACAAGAPVTRGWARTAVVVRLAGFISAFHQSGRCHRDLYLCHVFCDLDFAAQQPPRFTLIDLARVIVPGLRRMRWIIKDLGQLDASARRIGATRSDRLRFLRAYLGLERRAPRVRTYVRRVVRRSDGILAREQRQRASQ